MRYPDSRLRYVKLAGTVPVFVTDGVASAHVPDPETYRAMTGAEPGDWSLVERLAFDEWEALEPFDTLAEFEAYMDGQDSGEHPAEAHLNRIVAEVEEARATLAAGPPAPPEDPPAPTGVKILVMGDISPGEWIPARELVTDLGTAGDDTDRLRSFFSQAVARPRNYVLPRGTIDIYAPVSSRWNFGLKGVGEGTIIQSRFVKSDRTTPAVTLGVPPAATRPHFHRRDRHRFLYLGDFVMEQHGGYDEFSGPLLQLWHSYDSRVSQIQFRHAFAGVRGGRQIGMRYIGLKFSGVRHAMTFDWQSNGLSIISPRTQDVETALHLAYVNGATLPGRRTVSEVGDIVMVHGPIFEGISGTVITVGKPTPFGSEEGEHYAKCRGVAITGAYYEQAPGVIVDVGSYEGAVFHPDAAQYFATSHNVRSTDRYRGPVTSACEVSA